MKGTPCIKYFYFISFLPLFISIPTHTKLLILFCHLFTHHTLLFSQNLPHPPLHRLL